MKIAFKKSINYFKNIFSLSFSMVHVRSFKGYVARTDVAPELIAPPYDVLDTQEARTMAKGNEVNQNKYNL